MEPSVDGRKIKMFFHQNYELLKIMCLLRSKQNKSCLNVGDKTKNESLSGVRKKREKNSRIMKGKVPRKQ